MKFLKLILLFLLLGCQPAENDDLFNSTWKNCSKEGIYSEIKFTDKYMLILKTDFNEILLFRSNKQNSQIILS
jgi:hypothetical protein